MTSYVTPRKNVAHKFYVSLVDQSNTKLLKANPTIASGDFKVSTDGGAFANLATLPSANPASGRAIMIDLSSGEMNGDNIVVQCVDAAGAEWCDLLLNIQTTARQIDDLAFPATSGRSMVVDANGLVDANTVKVGPTGSGTAQTARDVGASVLLSTGTGTGQLDFTSGVVKANTTQLAAQTVTAAAGVTFPTSVASPTNITAGTITTATNVTNDVGITQAGADKVWGTTVRAITDKAGFALSSAGVQAIWDALTSVLTTVGSIGKLLVDNINATISSRMATFVYTAPLDAAGTRAAVGLASADLDTQLGALPTAAENSDAVWDEVLSGHLTATTTGAALNAASAAGDPWATALPGAYGAGTAGKIVGDNIDALISSRTKPADTQAAVTTVTNLTNAPTAGDLTATMKTSVTTAATAATPTAAAVTGAVGSVTGAVGSVTVVNDKTGYRLSATGVNDILRTTLIEGYAAQGAEFTLEEFAYMIWGLMSERGILTTVLTAGKLDHTPAMTFTLDSSTAPTTQERTT